MILKNNPKRALILIMSALVLIGFGIANLYYTNQNKAVDPRILEARSLYSAYDKLAQENDFVAIFKLLDAIEDVYCVVPYYANSFEMGVVYNNRAAAYLSMAIYFENNSLSLDGVEVLSKDSLLNLSEMNALQSVSYYEHWIDANGDLTEEALEQKIRNVFSVDFSSYNEKEVDRFVKKRKAEELDAQVETPRRLSVTYTNVGIICRHKEKYEDAIIYYKKAMELWDRNLAAKNNLNKLLGQPIEKQNFIEKILPPEK